MYISPYSSNTFNANATRATKFVSQRTAETVRTVKFSIPTRIPEKLANFEVTYDSAKNIANNAERTNITTIKYFVGDKENSYSSEKGLTEKKFRQIQKNIQNAIEEGKSFLYELIKAQHSFGK